MNRSISPELASAPTKVIDRTYIGLKRLVMDYEIEILPGHQIHFEDIANRLSVSVTPLREALNRLSTRA